MQMVTRVNEKYFQKNIKVNEPNIKFYDAREEKFQLYGFYQPRSEDVFKRIPDSVAKATSEGVNMLYTNTSGGRVRFATNSDYVAIKAQMPYVAQRSIMSLLCSAGFDLYIRKGGEEIYYASFNPPIDMVGGFENIIYFNDSSVKEITIYFPLYNDVNSLQIGINHSSDLFGHSEYSISTPIIYYGSSITQGACASRPGMSYEAIIARKLDCDFINLGFAGNAKGESSIIEYMASLNGSAFVCDYDHNAPTVEVLQNTHENLYRTIRNAHKDVPVLLITRPTVSVSNIDHIERRNVVYNTYENGIKNGDANLYFIDGFSLVGSNNCEDCFVDGVHPNDLGLYRMSKKIGKILRASLKKEVVEFSGGK